MSAPPTGQRRGARRLLRHIVGRLPEKPPGKVSSTIFLLASVVVFFLAVPSWWGGPSLSDLTTACFMLGVFLFSPMNPAHYRWWGELAGDLVRLGGMALFFVGLGLLIAEMALSGSWGWVWYSAFALALCVVAAVAGHYYGPEAEAPSEDANPEGSDPIN